MRPPFPGMDPWLEHPALWPDVHNSLIAAIRDAMKPAIEPKYYIGLESRTSRIGAEDFAWIGLPDLAVSTRHPVGTPGPRRPQAAGVVEVEVPMSQEVRETFLEVHDVETGTLVTLIEVLSPANKLSKPGRRKYERKRSRVFESRTNLVEIDLLRAGKPMPWKRRPIQSDYRILVSREEQRPQAQLYPFGLRDPIPVVPLPLLPGDEEPPMDLVQDQQ